jgi:subtilisin family serine protease
MSLQEIQREFGVSEDKARQFKRTANQQLGSVVNAAGQLGQSLARAFSKGERSAKSIAATLLQGVGGVLSVIPGVGQIAGPVLGQLGGLIGAFDEGGVVDTPLQLVGESGPELAALPQGTQVSTARETERMLSQQQVNVNVTGEIRRLRSRELGLVLREDETRRNQFGYSS